MMIFTAVVATWVLQVAVIVAEVGVSAVGVPRITPELVSKVRPVGRVVTE